MSIFAPHRLRARAMSPSAIPRCAPSASASIASPMSSLTIKSAPRIAHNSRSICARRFFFAAAAVLSRYCKSRAPPRKAASHWRRNSASSARCGVIAYKPRTADAKACAFFIASRARKNAKRMHPNVSPPRFALCYYRRARCGRKERADEKFGDRRHSHSRNRRR